MIHTILDSLLIGKPKPFRDDGTKSAMAREAVTGPVRLTYSGFDGDEVADKVAHGGKDKAVHAYPPEHYPYWNVKLEGHPLLGAAGAFGENISANGLIEDKVKIGDQFRIGDAILEVSQGRQPCWKLDHRFSAHGVSREVIRSGKSGFYFRVIEEGFVSAGDIIQQIYAADHKWSVSECFQILLAGGHRKEGAIADLEALSQLTTLSQEWRMRATKLVENAKNTGK